MVQIAAEGSTLQEIAATLSLPSDKDTVLNTFQQTVPLLRSSRKSTLTSANKIFVRQGFDLSQNFAKMANQSFDAGIETKDFDKPMKTATEINEWVKEKTNKKILQIIEPDMIDGLTKLILINALYFKGLWEYPFNSEFTQPRKFYTNSTNEVMTDMMYTIGEFGYFDHPEIQAKFLDLPYLENEFKMTIVLPHEKDGLNKLESNLAKVLDHKEMEVYSQVTVLLPKFKVEKLTRMNDILKRVSHFVYFIYQRCRLV